MGFIWRIGECMMSFIKRVNWLTLVVWTSMLTIGLTIWYFIIKLIVRSI